MRTVMTFDNTQAEVSQFVGLNERPPNPALAPPVALRPIVVPAAPVPATAVPATRTVARRTLIVGSPGWARTLWRELEANFPGDYEIVGLATENGAPNCVAPIAPILGGWHEVPQLVDEHRIDEVLIADYFAPEFKAINEELDAARSHGEWSQDGSWWARKIRSVEPVEHSPLQKALKRGFDIAVSSFALAAGAPFVALAALGIKISSPGPAIFAQKRVGQGGKEFTVYKLRTMVANAESKTGPVLAQHKDNRCTKLGLFLRLTHLDEWPQFWNVLKGDMTIVGPRPERKCFTDIYERHVPGYHLRHALPPGLTTRKEERKKR